MHLSNVFSFVALMGLSLSSAFANDDIVGGTLVQPTDVVARSTVILTDGNALCSASIIDTDLLVTAAHCVTGVGQLYVGFTMNMNRARSSNFQQVLGFEVTPEWAQTQGRTEAKDQGDIAVVRFAGGLPSGYEPVELLPPTDALRNGEVVVLAGYGITSAATQQGAGVLRKTEVTVKNAAFGQTEVELDQTEGRGACHGDSGGPAFVQSGANMLLWGLTNRGYPDNGPDNCLTNSIYTRVAPYAAWIRAEAAVLRGER
jgi:secreted trypsin-like serine protease